MGIKKIYISGKITGDANYKQKFKTAQNILEIDDGEWREPLVQVKRKWKRRFILKRISVIGKK